MYAWIFDSVLWRVERQVNHVDEGAHAQGGMLTECHRPHGAFSSPVYKAVKLRDGELAGLRQTRRRVLLLQLHIWLG